MTKDHDLAAIRARDAAWTADYSKRHESDGYGQAAADRRTLLELLRTADELVELGAQIDARLAQCGLCLGVPGAVVHIASCSKAKP